VRDYWGDWLFCWGEGFCCGGMLPPGFALGFVPPGFVPLGFAVGPPPKGLAIGRPMVLPVAPLAPLNCCCIAAAASSRGFQMNSQSMYFLPPW